MGVDDGEGVMARMRAESPRAVVEVTLADESLLKVATGWLEARGRPADAEAAARLVLAHARREASPWVIAQLLVCVPHPLGLTTAVALLAEQEFGADTSAAEAIAALPDDHAQALHTAVTEAAVAAAQQTQQRQQTPSAPSPPLRLVRRMGAVARGTASPVTGGSPVAVEPLSPPSNGNDGVPFPPRVPPASAAAAAGGEPISVSLMQKTRFVMTKLGLSGTMPAVAVEAAEHLGVDTTGKNTAAVLNECYRELLGDLAV
jgi:hypothetical protein